MKRAIYIISVFVIILSGLHLSVSTHYCRDNVAGVKLSFSGKEATCGMEETNNSLTSEKKTTTNCCHNALQTLEVDNNYIPSSHLIYNLLKKGVELTPLVSYHVQFSSSLFLHKYSSIKPPNNCFSKIIFLAYICVFRI
jgi:hypothetical protein